MVVALNSGEQRTRRAIAPAGQEEGPAEGNELDPRSHGKRFACFGHVYHASFLFLGPGRHGPSVRLREFDFFGLDAFLYIRCGMHMRMSERTGR
jgi:hypothetical protein